MAQICGTLLANNDEVLRYTLESRYLTLEPDEPEVLDESSSPSSCEDVDDCCSNTDEGLRLKAPSETKAIMTSSDKKK